VFSVGELGEQTRRCSRDETRVIGGRPLSRHFRAQRQLTSLHGPEGAFFVARSDTAGTTADATDEQAPEAVDVRVARQWRNIRGALNLLVVKTAYKKPDMAHRSRTSTTASPCFADEPHSTSQFDILTTLFKQKHDFSLVYPRLLGIPLRRWTWLACSPCC
jgi:hypothetical protein